MENHDIILGTGRVETALDWVPARITQFIGKLATLMGEDTVLQPPETIVREDGKTLFACSGVQIIYPQLFHDADVPTTPQLISQPVIRTQHLPYVGEGRSTSFVNYNLIQFGLSQTEHRKITKRFFQDMCDVDTRRMDDYHIKTLHDAPQEWNGLPITMTTNEKLWINGIELGESIYYGEMPLSSGGHVPVSELAFGLERLFFATEDSDTSYFSTQMGGIDTNPSLKDKKTAAVVDAIKSSTLMAMAGVKPGNKNHGSKMRKFLKSAVLHSQDMIQPINRGAIINNAYTYWSSFLIPEIEQELVRDTLAQELDRSRNRLVLDNLSEGYGVSVNMDINQTPQEFDKHLLQTGRVSREAITTLYLRRSITQDTTPDLAH